MTMAKQNSSKRKVTFTLAAPEAHEVALAGDFRIGIFQRRDNTLDAGLDDGVGARRRLAVMRARAGHPA